MIKCASNYINNEWSDFDFDNNAKVNELFINLGINILIQATDQGIYKT